VENLKKGLAKLNLKDYTKNDNENHYQNAMEGKKKNFLM
jgi:hypothetical protein